MVDNDAKDDDGDDAVYLLFEFAEGPVYMDPGRLEAGVSSS